MNDKLIKLCVGGFVFILFECNLASYSNVHIEGQVLTNQHVEMFEGQKVPLELPFAYWNPSSSFDSVDDLKDNYVQSEGFCIGGIAEATGSSSSQSTEPASTIVKQTESKIGESTEPTCTQEEFDNYKLDLYDKLVVYEVSDTYPILKEVLRADKGSAAGVTQVGINQIYAIKTTSGEHLISRDNEDFIALATTTSDGEVEYTLGAVRLVENPFSPTDAIGDRYENELNNDKFQQDMEDKLDLGSYKDKFENNTDEIKKILTDAGIDANAMSEQQESILSMNDENFWPTDGPQTLFTGTDSAFDFTSIASSGLLADYASDSVNSNALLGALGITGDINCYNNIAISSSLDSSTSNLCQKATSGLYESIDFSSTLEGEVTADTLKDPTCATGEYFPDTDDCRGCASDQFWNKRNHECITCPEGDIYHETLNICYDPINYIDIPILAEEFSSTKFKKFRSITIDWTKADYELESTIAIVGSKFSERLFACIGHKFVFWSDLSYSADYTGNISGLNFNTCAANPQKGWATGLPTVLTSTLAAPDWASATVVLTSEDKLDSTLMTPEQKNPDGYIEDDVVSLEKGSTMVRFSDNQELPYYKVYNKDGAFILDDISAQEESFERFTYLNNKYNDPVIIPRVMHVGEQTISFGLYDDSSTELSTDSNGVRDWEQGSNSSSSNSGPISLSDSTIEHIAKGIANGMLILQQGSMDEHVLHNQAISYWIELLHLNIASDGGINCGALEGELVSTVKNNYRIPAEYCSNTENSTEDGIQNVIYSRHPITPPQISNEIIEPVQWTSDSVSVGGGCALKVIKELEDPCLILQSLVEIYNEPGDPSSGTVGDSVKMSATQTLQQNYADALSSISTNNIVSKPADETLYASGVSKKTLTDASDLNSIFSTPSGANSAIADAIASNNAEIFSLIKTYAKSDDAKNNAGFALDPAKNDVTDELIKVRPDYFSLPSGNVEIAENIAGVSSKLSEDFDMVQYIKNSHILLYVEFVQLESIENIDNVSQIHTLEQKSFRKFVESKTTQDAKAVLEKSVVMRYSAIKNITDSFRLAVPNQQRLNSIPISKKLHYVAKANKQMIKDAYSTSLFSRIAHHKVSSLNQALQNTRVNAKPVYGSVMMKSLNDSIKWSRDVIR